MAPIWLGVVEVVATRLFSVQVADPLTKGTFVHEVIAVPFSVKPTVPVGAMGVSGLVPAPTVAVNVTASLTAEDVGAEDPRETIPVI